MRYLQDVQASHIDQHPQTGSTKENNILVAFQNVTNHITEHKIRLCDSVASRVCSAHELLGFCNTVDTFKSCLQALFEAATRKNYDTFESIARHLNKCSQVYKIPNWKFVTVEEVRSFNDQPMNTDVIRDFMYRMHHIMESVIVCCDEHLSAEDMMAFKQALGRN